MNGELQSGPQRAALEATVTQNFTDFLLTGEHGGEASSVLPSSSVPDRRARSYVEEIQAMLRASERTLSVDFMDLQRADADLAGVVLENFYRLEPTLRAALNGAVATVHREMQEAGEAMEDAETIGHAQHFVGLHNLPAVQRLRELRSGQVGKLASLSGTVTRTSEVRPELFYGAFECQECGTVVENVAQSFVYTEPPSCSAQACANRSKWTLVPTASVFVDWQKVRVQENADEIPAGSMPRSLDVILRADAVECVKPGDKAVLTGAMIAGDGVRGLAQLGVRHLSYKLAFVATSVARSVARVGSGGSATVLDAAAAAAETSEAFVERLPATVRARVFEMKHMDGLYARMTRSVAPAVRGHDEVKRGVLLMLLGGVHKRTKEGINLRGDLNVCVVGDPSTAKSQFLKWVTQFMPRAIYTSGKASSAAGLTATVAKDPDTGEFCIEAGALMLADNGVCCIDEFDKMEPQDQVAIHEAMEQQTISITKAGIQATLNARASILAAANPVYGRYDRTKTLRQNVALTAPIMSRFDLFFIVLDECDEAIDAEIARHIVSVHQRGDAAEALEQADFSLDDLRHYVAVARQVQPVLCPAAQLRLVQLYKRLRANDSVGAARSSYRITVRQLESMVRLAEALARLHLSATVLPEYVDEAYRLLRKSIIHVETTDAVELPGAADLPGMVRGAVRGANGQRTPAPPATAAADGDAADDAGAASKSAGQMTFAEYTEMAAAVVQRVLDTEEARGDGVRVGAVVEAQLEAMGIDSVEELARQRRRVGGVVRRLRRVDRVLVLGASAPLEVPDDEDDLVVTVHPHWGVN